MPLTLHDAKRSDDPWAWRTDRNDHQNVASFIHHRREELLRSPRGPKYRSFFRRMSFMNRIMVMGTKQGTARGDFLEAFYATMREEDDVGDGDRALPEGYVSAADVLEDNIAFIRKWQEGRNPSPRNYTQHLLAHCFSIARMFEEDFSREAIFIISSILFDAKRRLRPAFSDQRDLDENYDLLDIRGTVRGCLKIMNEHVEQEENITELARAVRIQYTLRDYAEDVRAGLVNISVEDAVRFGIVLNDLPQGIAHPGIRAWYEEQLALGMHLLDRHRGNIQKIPLRRTTKLILRNGYEQPARDFFSSQCRLLTGIQPESSLRTLARSPLLNLQILPHARMLALRHEEELGVLPGERKRFRDKVRNLALCYDGLSDAKSPRLSRRATEAALASAAYDVATDFREFDASSSEECERILASAPQEAYSIAMELYEKDRAGTLEHDGLERGSLAAKYIAIVMGIREDIERKGMPLAALGELFQIADDILDLEEDEREQQMNCLRTPRMTDHLQRYIDAQPHLLFRRDTILVQTLLKARLKAQVILRKNAELKREARGMDA